MSIRRFFAWMVVLVFLGSWGAGVLEAQVREDWWGTTSSQAHRSDVAASGEHWSGLEGVISTLPDDAVVAVAGAQLEGAQQQYDRVMELIDKAAAVEGNERLKMFPVFLKGWEKTKGISLRDDLFASLEGAAGVFVRVPDIPENFLDDPETVVRESTKCWGLVVHIRNKVRLEAFLSALSTDVGGTVSRADGRTEFRFPVKDAPSIAFFVELGSEHLSLGMNRGVALSLLSGRRDGGLVAQPQFKAVRAHLEPGYTAVLYVNGPAIRAAFMDILNKSGERKLDQLNFILSEFSGSKTPLVVGFYPEGQGLKAVSYGPDWDVISWLGVQMMASGLSW